MARYRKYYTIRKIGNVNMLYFRGKRRNPIKFRTRKAAELVGEFHDKKMRKKK